jgi:transposase-like protein
MNIIQQAQEFVQRLLQPGDPRRCPHCHKTLTKKNGKRWVTIRDLGGQGARQEQHQNWWCHLCQRTYYVADPRRKKYARYTRQVQRKSLDMYFHLGASLRGATAFLRSEINGSERYLVWNPSRRAQPPPTRPVKLHHTTIWRWEQQAGQTVVQDNKSGRWRDIIPFSGALVADATGLTVRGQQTSVHWIGDAVTGLSLRLQRLSQESNRALQGQFRAVLQTWNLAISQVRVLLSDGAAAYQFSLDNLLRQARQQRCLFHLWRNVLPAIHAYRHQAGRPIATELRVAIHQVWQADDLAQARRVLTKIRYKWRDFPALHPTFDFISRTLPEAMTHTTRPITNMDRTSNVAERFYRRYKQRIQRMGCFMSLDGCDHFNACWQIYINFEKFQKRQERQKKYRYPGRSPMDVTGIELHDLTWLDIIGL